jgi:small subunit ribosomal protein S17e
MNRIKRISMTLLGKYEEMFSTDFDANKKVLNSISIIRSKGLRNEIAGYITSYMRSKAKEKEVQPEAEAEVVEETIGEGSQ